ncbi:hypothetical protein SAMN04487910_1129 [Aquimarina amphilecti]|uniref:Nuclear transport factor 2 family protein n=1 Tax=Aquimarina amphilecti TaxID=1038014 RepID=A0A1H7JXA2_AQUAM|nr:hypothetical protein [Aquimarina amphilecti]SEK79112.1 hypothetical protein SAMN04487910_1129 [Aquimarina amphilecti]
MKNYLFILLFVSGSIFSQNVNKLKKEALRDAKAVSEASLKKDVNTILEYTHPKIFKEYGEEQLKNGIDQVFKTMTAQKIKIVSSKIDEVTEIKKEKKEYRCLVKNTIKMDFNGRNVTLKSSLFGFYNKKKEKWYFIESNKLLDDDETKKIFKNFKTEIEIPQDEHIAADY